MTNHARIKIAFSGVKAPEGFADRILNKTENTKTETMQRLNYKRRLITAAIVVILAVLVTSTLAFAKVLDFSRIYRIVFGGNFEYVEQYITPLVNEDIAITDKEDASCEELSASEAQPVDNSLPVQTVIQSECDGIVITLISAINDGDVLRIFATIQDTTSDRLGNSLDFPDWSLSEGHGGNISVIDYDRSTKTATVLITSLGEHPEGSVTMRISGISTERDTTEGLKESRISVYDILKSHTPQTISQSRDHRNIWKTGGSHRIDDNFNRVLFETTDVLAPDETNIAFDSVGWAHISNLGFVDGYLHIQTTRLYHKENHIMSINLVNEETGVVYDGDMQIGFLKYENRYGYDGNSPFYIYEEGIYKSITDIEQLKDLEIFVDIMEGGSTIEGKWEFSFDIPKRITTEFVVGRDILVNGDFVRIETVSISPLGVFLDLPENIASYYRHEDFAYVTYDDGTVIGLNETSIHGDQELSTLRFGGNVIEVERVRSIVINDEVISVG